MTHTQHSAKARVSNPCNSTHLTFGGRCLNCGYDPTPAPMPNADWLLEQREHEIVRLSAIGRNPDATVTEKSVARDMLKQYIPDATNPAADFILEDDGSLFLLSPKTVAACDWASEHIGRENGYQPLWPTVVVEPRYADVVIAGACRDGLTVVRA